MITPSLLVRPLQRVARLVSDVRASTRTAISYPSKLARSFAFGSSLDQSKRARVKEHRLSENTIDLVCRLPRAQGLTRLVPPHSGVGVGRAQETNGLPLSPLVRVGRAKETNSLRPSMFCARCASNGDQQPSPLAYLIV
jgi:hypothetical protein